MSNCTTCLDQNQVSDGIRAGPAPTAGPAANSNLTMTPNPLCRAGIVLGLGLGGFFDGIVLHQILGWHHMVCTTETCQPISIEHLTRQNTQDGFFHLAVWIITIVGVILLFQAARRSAVTERERVRPSQPWSGKALFGAILAGWGIFNFVEGLIDHQILGLHHVRPGHPDQFLFDMLFLGVGVVLVLIGSSLVTSTTPGRMSRAP